MLCDSAALVSRPPSDLHIKDRPGADITDIQDFSDGTQCFFEGLSCFDCTKNLFTIVHRVHESFEYLHFFTFITALFWLHGAILPWWRCPR